MTRSIHGRVAAGVMAGLFVVLTLCGSALYLYVRHALTANFDDALAGKARAFAALSKQDEEEYEAIVIGLDQLPQSARETVLRALDSSSIEDLEQITHEGRLFYKVETIRRGVESEFLVSGDGVYLGVSDEFDFAFDKAALPEFQPSSKAEYYHVWDEDNDTVAKSPSLGEAALAIPHAVATSPRTYNITLPDGRSGRAIARQFIPRSDGPGENEPLTLVMAQSREGLDQSLRVVRTGLLMAAVLTALAIIAVVRLSVHVGLRALNTLASQAATIDADTLAYRFPADGMTAELAPICERLNELLARLDGAFQRERRFTSDSAHELRTPISELRTLSEVGLQLAPDFTNPGDATQYFQDALAIANQMERLVTTLLALARCQSGSQPVAWRQVDVARVVQDAWKPLHEEAHRRGLSTTFVLPPEAVVETDSALLGLVISNLLSNAVAHTPGNGIITLETGGDETSVNLALSNSNNSLEAADLPRVFESFWRKDSARTGASHSGLGLSMVRELVALLRIDIDTGLPAPDLFRVSLRIPRVRGPQRVTAP